MTCAFDQFAASASFSTRPLSQPPLMLALQEITAGNALTHQKLQLAGRSHWPPHLRCFPSTCRRCGAQAQAAPSHPQSLMVSSANLLGAFGRQVQDAAHGHRQHLSSSRVSRFSMVGETSSSNLLCAFGGQVKDAAHRRRQCRAAAGLIHSAGRSRRVRYLVLPPDDNAALLRM